MIRLFTRTPKPETIRLAEHVRITTQKIAEARRPLLAENEGLRNDVRQAEQAYERAAAELATLRAAREKANANLRAWNERRRAGKAAAEVVS